MPIRAGHLFRTAHHGSSERRAHQDALIEVYDSGRSQSRSQSYRKTAEWTLVRAPAFRDRPDEARSAGSAITGKRFWKVRPAASPAVIRTVAPTDWVRKRPRTLPIGGWPFVVHGAHHRGIPANRIASVDAGLAFGTSHHGSTRGCRWRSDRIMKQAGSSNRKKHNGRKKVAVLDVGTGTGVLAIAAAKAGRSLVLASDIDPRAVTIARNNARINGVAAEIMVVHAASIAARQFLERAPFDLVLANILLEPIEQFATALARLVAERTSRTLGPAQCTSEARACELSCADLPLQVASRWRLDDTRRHTQGGLNAAPSEVSTGMFEGRFQSFAESAEPAASAPRVAIAHRLARRNLSFIVPRADRHQDEYLPPSEERLAWLTGFTGSAGIAIASPRSRRAVRRRTLHLAGHPRGGWRAVCDRASGREPSRSMDRAEPFERRSAGL